MNKVRNEWRGRGSEDLVMYHTHREVYYLSSNSIVKALFWKAYLNREFMLKSSLRSTGAEKIYMN